METDNTSRRSLRGFASMDKTRQREIASRGGRAAHQKGTAHEFNSMEATMAAKKGHEQGTAHEFTPEEARVAGRKGGLARAQNRVRASQDRTTETHSETHAVTGENNPAPSEGSSMEYSG